MLQVVNFAPEAQHVDVELLGLHSSPAKMTVTLLNSTNPLSENSFDEPYMVSQPSTIPNANKTSRDCMQTTYDMLVRNVQMLRV